MTKNKNKTLSVVFKSEQDRMLSDNCQTDRQTHV